MRNYLFYSCLMAYMLLFCGCATTKEAVVKQAVVTETVEAEGQSPIINNDMIGAKNAALADAQRAALGLVVGVYVTGETLVSKAVLLEENILGQTQGYIERYAILKEYREEEFYKVRIKAAVRKEDLANKINDLQLEEKPSPVVAFWIDEFVEDKQSEESIVESQLSQGFINAGFRVSDDKTRKIFTACEEAEKQIERINADILVLGKAVSRFVTDKDLGGLISYRATISLKMIKANSKEVIATIDEVCGGVDITNDAAAKASLKRVVEKIDKDFAKKLYETLEKQLSITLKISGIADLNELNLINRLIRSFLEVTDCRVMNYSGNSAVIEITLKRGNAQDIARRLEQIKEQKISVISAGQYDIEAVKK
ncbi:MAG: hypothetical protein ABH886_05985 [Candidatus Desantisbacteria bacterium]